MPVVVAAGTEAVKRSRTTFKVVYSEEPSPSAVVNVDRNNVTATPESLSDSEWVCVSERMSWIMYSSVWGNMTVPVT
ncbi:hypothetical protein N7517_009752 [Penicillium concentricum]|uniref:Uncharacterized protein n=1 Tax=Penicillium concentricum TaxID=293559 RepID=A0A9W9RIA6_9EURO|nr:uncharacterized protein N7517_009752 [Penicillium concentricum]KAJ5360561.1 hypothetical protein N7517_009752 [Penicillium concentricum]